MGQSNYWSTSSIHIQIRFCLRCLAQIMTWMLWMGQCKMQQTNGFSLNGTFTAMSLQTWEILNVWVMSRYYKNCKLMVADALIFPKSSQSYGAMEVRGIKKTGVTTGQTRQLVSRFLSQVLAYGKKGSWLIYEKLRIVWS